MFVISHFFTALYDSISRYMVLVGSEKDLEERALSVDRLKKTKDFRVKAEFEPMTLPGSRCNQQTVLSPRYQGLDSRSLSFAAVKTKNCNNTRPTFVLVARVLWSSDPAHSPVCSVATRSHVCCSPESSFVSLPASLPVHPPLPATLEGKGC